MSDISRWGMRHALRLVFVVLLAMGAVSLLAGCQPSSLVRGAVQIDRDARSAVSDAAIEYLCNGMTLREWRPRFGTTRSAATAWALMCATEIQVPPILEAPDDVEPEPDDSKVHT